MAILVLQCSLEANSLRQMHFFYLLIKIKLLIRKILPNRQNYFYGKATLGFLCIINFVWEIVLNYKTGYMLCQYPRPLATFCYFLNPLWGCRGAGRNCRTSYKQQYTETRVDKTQIHPFWYFIKDSNKYLTIKTIDSLNEFSDILWLSVWNQWKRKFL